MNFIKRKNQWQQKFLNGCNDTLGAALNDLDNLKNKEIQLFSERCRSLIHGDFKEDFNNLYRLNRAGYGLCYRTKFHMPDFLRLKAYGGENFPAVLTAGMTHYNGYFREKCALNMVDFPEYLPFLIHGFNDWVYEVRVASEKVFEKIFQKSTLKTVILTYSELQSIAKCNRYDKSALDFARKKIAERIKREASPQMILDTLICQKETKQNRALLAIILDKILTAENVEELIARSAKSKKSLLTLAYIRNYQPCNDKLIKLTANKNSRIRYFATVQLCEKKEPWDGAESLLLDKSSSMRGLMQYYYKMFDNFDLKQFYRSEFPYPEAIKGFGECGVFADESEIKPFVSSENEKIAAAAVYALFKLTSDGNDALYYDMITDSRQQVSKAAFKAMNKCRNAVPETVYNDIISHRSDQLTAKRLVRILCRNTGSLWNSMPWFIRLYNAPEEYIYIPVRIAVSKRNYVYLSTAEHAEEIKRAMEESPLPKTLAKQIYKEIGVI